MSSPVAVGERTKAYLRELQMIIFSEPYIICQYFEINTHRTSTHYVEIHISSEIYWLSYS